MEGLAGSIEVQLNALRDKIEEPRGLAPTWPALLRWTVSWTAGSDEPYGSRESGFSFSRSFQMRLWRSRPSLFSLRLGSSLRDEVDSLTQMVDGLTVEIGTLSIGHPSASGGQ